MLGAVMWFTAYLVIVDTRAEGTKEVNGLAGEAVHNVLNLRPADTIVLEDAHAHTNTVLAGW